jgi:hypothetical protein
MADTEGWWFETSRFEGAPSLEEEVNPGRYGKLLASWLLDTLRARGWEVQEIFPEDWGWVVSLQRDGSSLEVNCGNEDGSLTRWSVQPKVRVGFLQRLFGRSASHSAALTTLDADLRAIIASDPKTTWHGREQPGARRSTSAGR